MQILNKHNVPFLFLLGISASWAFYYQSSNILNNYGAEKSEWLLFIDGLIVLPLLCFWCIKDKREASIKALAYGCLIILLGSFAIPESSKFIWHYLESGRYLAIAGFVVFELVTIFTVFFAVKASLTKSIDPDKAITKPIESLLGKGSISNLLSFEARVWTYALFSKRIKKQHFTGYKHFSCHKKDGAQSNQLGFTLMILFELPIMHLLLHFLWSPWAANITTGLTFLGLTFFIAEYKAISIRPVSLTQDSLIIRYGIWNPLEISLTDIESVQLNSNFIPRSNNVKRFNSSGNPNIEIKLTSGKFLYLGLDSPNELIQTIQSTSKVGFS